ncbi:hypothetical protein GCK72_020407 [Caenorhabditis remanei]|uniref:Seven TM Receptor n=1 Tax=Caenorhabditis remanei TaxID=31234 RepID=A0A6A5GFF6_CAERE|nr:hypothetical protein GCK72_020407 [Caenorhabditis remanei]KAF1753850.1 hypothetical protein GCK72_020407 [Caenorhabditis remanei]
MIRGGVDWICVLQICVNMMPQSTWSTITHLFGWFSFLIAIWATITLFVLIEKKSRKEFGGYKNFLRIYCCYAFLFCVVDWLVQPYAVVDIYGIGYVFYSENRLFDMGYSVTHLLQVLYCGCFVASSSFLSLNFIYRYISSCHRHWLHHFQGLGLIIVILYCVLPFLIWSFCVTVFLGPTPEMTAYFNISTMYIEQFDLTDKPYHVSTTPFHQVGDVNWGTMGSFIGLGCFQVLFYGISLVCGILTYKNNMKLLKLAQLSKNLYKTQMQLLRAIVMQAVTPLIFVYIPPAIIITGSVTGIYVGELGHFVVMSISMYPPLDSLVFLLSIRDYRNALFCNTKTDSRSESSNIRPATAKVSVRNREWSGLNLEFSNET